MKVGIITFWESKENYGQLLQAFALQSYLEKLGHEPFLIKFHRKPPAAPRKSIVTRLLNLKPLEFVKGKLKSFKLADQIKSRGFDDFRTKYINLSGNNYYSLQELKASPPIADAYICGSDQVWNNTFSVPCEPFLLGFGNSTTKRIAYAASFGQTDLSGGTKEIFKKYLPSFTSIGVREKGGLQLCYDLGFKNSSWVPDPTLFFDKREWVRLLNLSEYPRSAKQHIFLYTLGNSAISDKYDYINFVKNLPDTEIKHATANMETGGNIFPTIPEWLSLIQSSDFVITNSFHGMVFCIIFNRNFVILPNTGSVVGMNDRINSILEKLGLQDQLMSKFESQKLTSIMQAKIDWTNVNERILNWKKEATAFLINALQ